MNYFHYREGYGIKENQRCGERWFIVGILSITIDLRSNDLPVERDPCQTGACIHAPRVLASLGNNGVIPETIRGARGAPTGPVAHVDDQIIFDRIRMPW